MNPVAKRSSGRGVALLVALMLAVGFVGCNSGGRDGANNIPNINQSAAPLPEDNRSYSGPDLNRDRYSHTATTLEGGRVLIVGGTDERHLTALDTAEIFDQSLIEDPAPASRSGGFIDTDFNGNPIVMKNGGRIFHTATRLGSGNVLVAGGTQDALIAQATAVSEIFDVTSREFAPDFLEITDDMTFPRFRHSAVRLGNGRILFVGGQISVQETIIDPNFPPGSPFFQIDVEVFPSTETIEVFRPSDLSFAVAQDLSGNATKLLTPRGRGGHESGILAGADGLLRTGDDAVVHVGGFQTLSPLFAPQFKFPGQLDTDKQSGAEYYDLTTGTNNSALGVSMLPRSNDVIILNLGIFQRETPDGVDGLNNILFITHGDDDRAGGGCHNSVLRSESIVTTFTGFGAGNGIQFRRIAEDTMLQNYETQLALLADPPCFFGRTEAPAVLMLGKRFFNDMGAEEEVNASYVVTAGGHHLFTGIGCIEVNDTWCLNDLQGFAFFDPLYDAAQIPARGVDSLENNRTNLNPTGATGTWLNFDGDTALGLVDDVDNPMVNVGFAEGSTLADLNVQRLFHTLTIVPGEDGIINSLDDRILVVGGGVDFFPEFGGEPVAVGSEIYLPFGANN